LQAERHDDCKSHASFGLQAEEDVLGRTFVVLHDTEPPFHDPGRPWQCVQTTLDENKIPVFLKQGSQNCVSFRLCKIWTCPCLNIN